MYPIGGAGRGGAGWCRGRARGGERDKGRGSYIRCEGCLRTEAAFAGIYGPPHEYCIRGEVSERSGEQVLLRGIWW